MVRYNAGYPCWAYDQYCQALPARAQSAGWFYLDLWNAIPPQYFLDVSLHLGAEGERLLIERSVRCRDLCVIEDHTISEDLP